MPYAPTPERSVPHNLEAERALLGSILLDNEALDFSLKHLSTYDFYSQAHQITFSKMAEMAKQKMAIDLVTLSEELAKDGLLEKAGGAAYLSALTDGVPIGTKGALPEYCRIVKEKATRREELKAAWELAERVKQGASAEEISEQAKKITEIKPAKSSSAIKDKYPLMPKEALHPCAELYLRAVGQSTEASDNYHLACFLTTIGALIGRTVFIRKGRITYPNLFTVLVGRSGARKGTAMSLALEFLDAVDPRVYVLDSIDSKESAVKELADHQAELYGEGWTAEHREILAMEEFGMLIEKAGQKGTRNIMPFLCKLYDCPNRETNKAFSSKAEVKEPTMSVESGTSETYLEPLTIRDIKGGAGNRVCWVGGDPKPRKDDPPDPDHEILDNLITTVRNRISFYRERKLTRFYLSPAAAKRYKKFYETEYNPATGDEMMEVLGERDAQTALKVAMIYAVLDQAPETIELHHIEAAIAYTGFLYSTRIPIFSGHGLSYAAAAQERIVEIVQREGAVPLARLQGLMKRHCDATLLEKYIRALAFPGGPVKVDTFGRKTVIVKGDA
jgi:hypothetical protein